MKAAVAEAACHRSAADAGIVAIGLFRPVILLLFRWESRNIRDLILISFPPGRARVAAGALGTPDGIFNLRKNST